MLTLDAQMIDRRETRFIGREGRPQRSARVPADEARLYSAGGYPRSAVKRGANQHDRPDALRGQRDLLVDVSGPVVPGSGGGAPGPKSKPSTEAESRPLCVSVACPSVSTQGKPPGAMPPIVGSTIGPRSGTRAEVKA